MKIGLLGGSFNPIHTGHVRMAIEVRERLELDRVELIPAKQPPHKSAQDILPFDLRMSMVEVAIAGIPGLGVNPIEGERPGPSFTCDTLTCYRTEKPQAELFFIMGAGTFLELENWQRGMEIPDLANLAVVTRWTAAERVAGFIRDHWPQAEELGGDQWRFPSGRMLYRLDIPRLDIKAGEIRYRWKERRDLTLLVPDAVRAVLDERETEIVQYWGERI
ncbi:nicotinate (nicotinamide) nucleotide adenylyltransferase [Salidesulfovibrio onnuriiensis]|uniref:nicotinate (nicotinamide) nucleotide adenylyltransferase n=1 Tax=Salidesulfovibrio onnuriiensis TaxID=2583823 RepID=UPI0011CBA83E|nr:nicotinate (nicotinamide) nucleotide adenylyltransferase [Salidesulfovibrio onnuriiensis]